ncbi:MAG: hypothetical protein LBF77_06310, partial [Spirochaetaceae bacterium]|nr:hypothetical protein [Spirochaetaceae bacterium]
MSIQRIFVGKKPGFDIEARGVWADIAGFLGAQYGELARLKGFRLFNRYDAGRLDGDQFRRVVDLVLSEPQCDQVFYGETLPLKEGERAFAIEYLPGQYDQRADSAEQCAELVTGLRPVIRSARVFVLEAGGAPVSDAALEAVKRYLINPVDSREARAELPETLEPEEQEIPDVPVLAGFIQAGGERLAALREEYGLAMSADDLRCCRDYFKGEGRDPTLTELRILDTYWSDHCRHTTFTTVLERIDIESCPEAAVNELGRGQTPPAAGPRSRPTPSAGGQPPATPPDPWGQAPANGDRPPVSPGSAADDAGIEAGLRNALSLYEQTRREVYGEAERERGRTLMDMATIGTKALKKRGLIPDLDESKEINACTVKVEA